MEQRFPALPANALIGVMMVAGTVVGSLIPNVLQDMAPGPLRARVIAVYTILSMLLAGAAPMIVGWVSDMTMERSLLIAMTLVSFPTWTAALLPMRLAERPFARLVYHVSTSAMAAS